MNHQEEEGTGNVKLELMQSAVISTAAAATTMTSAVTNNVLATSAPPLNNVVRISKAPAPAAAAADSASFDTFVMNCLRRSRSEGHPSCDVILR